MDDGQWAITKSSLQLRKPFDVVLYADVLDHLKPCLYLNLCHTYLV